FFITTAIDYTNSAPHIGHAYEKILADVIARYRRLKGDNVFFLTGVDQHGQKVQQSAEREGVPPEQFVAGVTEQFIALWDKLDVRYDAWAATTDPLHKKCVQGMLQRLFDEGKIYKDKQVGFYSVRQEQFLTDKDRNEAGEFGPEWGEVEQREEENYYFKLAEHKQWLLDFIDARSKAGKPFVVPDFRVAELRNAVEKLGDGSDRQSGSDLCISRPKSRLSWGIELPFDRDYVNYVWFDALTNYISFIGYDPARSTISYQPSTFRDKWPALHVIGKDIMIPAHGIYWPIMLHALGFPDEQLPTLLVHGWWNISGAKMSKSLGNVVDPDVLIDKYGVEGLRYYLMSDIVTGKDADFSEERLVERYNADLANSLGNLLNRTLNMTARYEKNGQVYSGWELEEDVELADWVKNTFVFSRDLARTQIRKDDELLALLKKYLGYEQLPDESPWDLFWVLEHMATVSNAVNAYSREFEEFGVQSAVEVTLQVVASCNRLVERTSPWALVKRAGGARILGAILYAFAESLRMIAVLISPVLPKAAHRIFDQLNWKTELSGKEERFRLENVKWGGLPDGHVVGKPVPLFPRIER
ncbi:MAG: methionine--tRNA ligase, partial [Verrucomicrobia bacterium]